MKTVFTLGFRAEPRLMTGTIIMAVLSGLAGGITPLGIKRFVDGIASSDRPLVVSGAVILSVGAAGAYAAGTAAGLMGLKLIGHVGLYVNAKIAELTATTTGIEHFEHPGYLRELDLLLRGAFSLGFGPQHATSTLRTGLQLALSISLLVAIDPYLAALFAAAPIPLVMSRRAARLREHVDEQLAEPRRRLGDLFQLVTSAPSGRELRLYGLAQELIGRHVHLADQVSTRVTRTHREALLLTATGWCLYALALVTAVIYVTIRAAAGAATIGAAVLTMQVGRQASGQIAAITNSVTQLFALAKTSHRLVWLEDYAAEARPPDATVPIPTRLDHGIDLTGVSFRYPGTEATVLTDIDLHLPAGATVALVGANGAGKTTLVKLLTAMYAPTTGSVLIDRNDLADLDTDRWRQRIAAGFQDFVRFELLARHAVGVGDLPRADDTTAVEAALRQAGATRVIERLGEGLATQLGRSVAGGQELSGGEWQQLALGRAMMREAPLLVVLDEPTASLDAATEHALFERYADAAHRTGRTNGAITILVSHRFSTVQMADLIVVLDQNRITEVGTHAELIAAGRTYAKLYAIQAASYT